MTVGCALAGESLLIYAVHIHTSLHHFNPGGRHVSVPYGGFYPSPEVAINKPTTPSASPPPHVAQLGVLVGVVAEGPAHLEVHQRRDHVVRRRSVAD